MFPGHRVGSVQLLTVSPAVLSSEVSTTPLTIAAHKNALSLIALNATGTMAATASTKVTTNYQHSQLHTYLHTNAYHNQGFDIAISFSLNRYFQNRYFAEKPSLQTIERLTSSMF